MNLNKKWIAIIVVAVVAATIIITNRQGTPLPSYDASHDVPAATQEAATQATIPDGFAYTDEETGLSLFIPNGWQYILKDGYATFAHKASSSWVQVRVMDYYPQVASASADSYATLAQEQSGSLVSFDWYGNSSYLAKYVVSAGSGVADHIDAVLFDRLHVVDISYVLDDEYYSRLADTAAFSLDSISWDRQLPVPQTLYLEYSEYGNFEFGIPYNWEGGYADGAYYAREPQTGASYSVTVSESNTTFESATQEDYISFAGAGRENLTLGSFVNDGSVIIAEGSYYLGEQRMLFRQCLLANGTYEYSMTQECPATGYEVVAQAFDDLMDVFRVF